MFCNYNLYTLLCGLKEPLVVGQVCSPAAAGDAEAAGAASFCNMDNDCISSNAQMLLSGSGWERNVGKADPGKSSHDTEGAEMGTQAIMARLVSKEANNSVAFTTTRPEEGRAFSAYGSSCSRTT